MSFPLSFKHSGKTYTLNSLDPSTPSSSLLSQIAQLADLDPLKLKVPIKGGKTIQNDDTPISSLPIKQGSTLMVIGSKSQLVAPTQKITFSEDVQDETEGLETINRDTPGGLTNLGNTCYLNSTLQALRIVPFGLPDRPTSDIARAVKTFYDTLPKNGNTSVPIGILTTLRTQYPQFAEMSRSGGGFAQQDAQEAWSSIVHTLSGEQGDWVEKYMKGKVIKTLKLSEDEAAEEAPTKSEDSFLEIKCNIDSTTNYLISGITANSPTLSRSAVYEEKSEFTRLPTYLTINLIRFFWRREISKKAKIMRKVKFNFELDLFPFVHPDLQERMKPLRDHFRVVEGLRRDKFREEVKTKGGFGEGGWSGEGELKEKEVELRKLVEGSGQWEEGESRGGVYELVGVVTHKGASADGGHYIAFTRQEDQPKEALADPEKELWWRFDDEKVDTVSREKIASLDGGGEDHCAYVLLYRAKKME